MLNCFGKLVLYCPHTAAHMSAHVISKLRWYTTVLFLTQSFKIGQFKDNV